jgi:ERF superfamily protein
MTIEAQRLATIPPPKDEGPPILHVFERALRDVSMPLERVREIYALKREIEADLAEQEYIRARSLVEQELEPVAKDASNPSTRSKYATLAAVIQAVRPVYSKHGIIVEFDTTTSGVPDGWIRVLAFLSHQAGYKRTFHIDMPADGKGAQGRDVMTRTHATGSAYTYGRRYLLLGIFNLAVEDDDGNAASRGKATGELLDTEQMEYVWEKAREYCDPDVQQEWIELLVKSVGHDNLAEVPQSLFEMLRQKIIAWPKSPGASKWKTQ